MASDNEKGPTKLGQNWALDLLPAHLRRLVIVIKSNDGTQIWQQMYLYIYHIISYHIISYPYRIVLYHIIVIVNGVYGVCGEWCIVYGVLCIVYYMVYCVERMLYCVQYTVYMNI